MMNIKMRLSEAFNKVKARFTRTERESDAQSGPLTAADRAEETLPQAESLYATAAETICPERDALTPEGAPEDGAAENEPGRMTDEYKAWLKEQREAADAANADVNIDSVQ